MRRFLIFVLVAGTLPLASAQDQLNDFEGSAAGDRRELLPEVAFRWCPAGDFVMGNLASLPERIDQQPVKVTLSQGFWLGEAELTQGQWETYFATTPWQSGPPPWKGYRNVKEGPNYPATYISHTTAVKFCERLTVEERKASRLPEGWKYSLPTDAQWEYACRAGSTTRYSFGENEASLEDYCWFRRNARDEGEYHAHQVGLKKSNAWGFKDMHGNVFEWCSDWHGYKLTGGRNPQGPSTGSNRVLRGGSWHESAEHCQSFIRGHNVSDLRSSETGFRLAAVRE